MPSIKLNLEEIRQTIFMASQWKINVVYASVHVEVKNFRQDCEFMVLLPATVLFNSSTRSVRCRYKFAASKHFVAT